MAEYDAAQAIREYRETGDINLRNDIVMRYLELVRVIALSLRNVYIKYAGTDDIINEGVIALISAIDTFDLDRGVKFETYANIKVKGAIVDFVRKQDWIPRQVRVFGRELDIAYNELFTKLGRHPKNAELAEHLGLSREKLERLMAESASAVTLSFEELLYEDNFDIMESGDLADKRLYENELKQMIAKAIEGLSPKARQVITLYYYEKLKFNEIARVLGITESRVCQIHSKAVLFLKRSLSDYMER
ncbi:MAG: FliA/WhiG family RNA polymerase sigma factor [Ruminiclostridium sp.]|nr:FliA/WhiG family RNA polymerase sigma factor [Ruminiclostridium sp.]